MASENLLNEIRWKHLEKLSGQFGKFRVTGHFTDITLTDKNGNCHAAHKNILAASSPYFKEKFISDAALKSFDLPIEVSTSAIETLMKFCYGGCFDVPEDTGLIKELITAAEILKFHSVAQHCNTLIFEKGDFLSLWQYAEAQNNEDTKKTVAKLMAKDFIKIEESPDFLEIPFECLYLTLGEEELKDHDEDLIFKYILKWIKKDTDERVKHMKTFTEIIRWDYLTTDFLNSLQEDEDTIMENPILMKQVLKEVTKRLKNPQDSYPKRKQNQIESPPAVSVETPHKIVPVQIINIDPNSMGGNKYPTAREAAYQSESYRPLLDIIDQRSQRMNYDRGELVLTHTTAPPTEIPVADSLFLQDLTGNLVTMKIKDDKTTIKVRKLNENKIISSGTVSDIYVPRNAAFCQTGSKMLIIGGRNDNWEVLSTFYSYDVKSGKWEILPDMDTERWVAGATATDNSVYVVGGVGMENKRLNKVECYSRTTRQWSYKEDMKMCRERPAVCNCNDCIFVVGGYTVAPDQWKKSVPIEMNASYEIYDPRTNQWTSGETQMAIGRNINEKVFVIGVMDGKICALRAMCGGKFILNMFNMDRGNWIDLPATYYENTEQWISLNVLKNRVICLVDSTANIYIYKSNGGLRKIQTGNETRPNECYSAVFE